MTAAERLLERLEGVKGTGDRRWSARCPGHDDRNPSLTVTEKANGDLLVFCHAECGSDLKRILSPVDLSPRDLFAERATDGHTEIVAEYDYTTESGELLFQVVRFAPKDFRQRRPDGVGGWEWSLNGTRRVLYRLPQVREAVKRDEDIFIVEGEKDVERLESEGTAATCNPGGAGKWRSEYSESLRGAKVTIVADRDKAGRDHARQVAEALEGVATTVDLAEPAEGCNDVSEHFAAGRSLAQLVLVNSFRPPKRLGVDERKSGLPFAPLGDALASAPPEPEWRWEGYLAPGAVALLAGRPKVGKSTLAFALLAALGEGRPFLGLTTRQTGALLLSEEREATLAEKQHRFALNGTVDLLMRHQTSGERWPEIVAQAVRRCQERGFGLLVADTFDKWVGIRGDDENKSGPVLEALEPLTKAAGEGLAVLILTHQRKAQGSYGEAVRGSNALTGGVDVVVEIERAPADLGRHARVLRAASRFAGTPEELALELTDEGYEARGDLEQLAAATQLEDVRAALGVEALTAAELADATDLKKATVHRRLEELRDAGEIVRRGEGKKGDPYRFQKLSSTAEPLGGRNESREAE